MQYSIRKATQADMEFLVEMAALFGQDRDSVSVKDWPRKGWDFGLIAEDEHVTQLGAAWWRQFEWIPSPEWREVFGGRREEHRGHGIGVDLLDKLIEFSWAEKTILRLAGRVVQGEQTSRINKLLKDRDFTFQYGGQQRRYWKRSVSDHDY